MTTAPDSLRARLHFIELGSPDPQRLANFYAELFDAPVIQEGEHFVLRDADRAVVFREGPEKSLLGAGFQVENPDVIAPLHARLAAQGVEVRSLAPTSLYEPGAIGFHDPDGSWLQYGVATAAPAPRTGLPGRLQHVVLGSTNAAQMIDFTIRWSVCACRIVWSARKASCALPFYALMTNITASRCSRPPTTALTIIAMKAPAGVI